MCKQGLQMPWFSVQMAYPSVRSFITHCFGFPGQYISKSVSQQAQLFQLPSAHSNPSILANYIPALDYLSCSSPQSHSHTGVPQGGDCVNKQKQTQGLHLRAHFKAQKLEAQTLDSHTPMCVPRLLYLFQFSCCNSLSHGQVAGCSH